ncbi:MAG: hypothetical protein H6Q74_1818 [Firmicutes bacterium]|nr:hypothetical protein [Bacillota bacterium]
MHIESLMWLFPIAFMFHDFEEIIFLPAWIKNNATYLTSKYPRIGKKLVLNYKNKSSSAFALAVFEEFIILVILTLICVELKYYSFFAALALAYLTHVIVHVIQFIALKKYIPAVGSAVLTGIYNIYSLYTLDYLGFLNWEYIGILTPPVIIVMGLNLFFALWLADKIMALEK